ncbi:MAG: hypothetical protein H6550_10380 [Chitinophagales bacterium]|nr:hypothetical protein [Chitinophagales bacterium]
MLKIRVFRAIDDLESCRRFAEGHANVLRDYGVTKVTSSKNDWFYNPDVYVALVEMEDTGVVVGGERIHMVNKKYPLPIEEAVSVVEKRIFDLVADYADNKVTGELCGLWNAKAIAGKGVSILLTKLGVAMANRLKMDSLFVLCAPYTVSMCQAAGFEIETSIGNNGTFIYPKLDLVATALVVKDIEGLNTAADGFRKEIFSYIEKPVSNTIVLGEKGETEVAYNLLLPNKD